MSDDSLKNLNAYEHSYSDESFWEKVGKIALQAGRKVIRVALLLYYVLQDDNVPMTKKSLIIGGLVYFISPIDVIPDAVPVVGWTDDFAVLYGVYKVVAEYVTPEMEQRADEQLRKWFD